MSIILASRGVLTLAAQELLRALPIAVSCAAGMSIIAKSGRLVNDVSSTAAHEDADVVVLFEEAAGSNKLKLLASDGLAVMKRTGKPVLLQPARCSVKDTGSVLVAVSGDHQTPQNQWELRNVLDLADREVVVLSLSRPYHPLFGRGAPGMQAYRWEALRDVWSEQANEASANAAMIAESLKSAGAKSWYVGRTGRFVPEIQKTVQSADVSMTCILVDSASHKKWFASGELADVMEAVNIPVLLAPIRKN